MIEPALTPEEWAEIGSPDLEDYMDWITRAKASRVAPGVIAIANAKLDDADPRKITRHSVWLIRRLIEASNIDTEQPGGAQLVRESRSLIDALESLLPPRQ